ncbi:hypothetical protein vseg_015664 [Gypsophila vaccaria]
MIVRLKNYVPRPQQCTKLLTFTNPNYYINSRIKLSKNLKELKTLKSLLIISGLINHKHVVSSLISQSFDVGPPEFALSIFNASKNRSFFLHNHVIKHLSKLGLYKDVIFVYKSCVISGNYGGDYTFPFVIKSCAVLGDFDLGREVHCVVLRRGFDYNVVVQTAIVDLYSKLGRVGVARKVFDEMPEWDLVSCNALISGYCYNGFDFEGLGVFTAMWANGVKGNVPTLASVVPLCTRLRFWNLGRSLHCYAIKVGFSHDESLVPAFISMYASDGDVNVCESLFDHSLVHNVVIWTSMICAYVQNQMTEQGFEMFSQMGRADLRPSLVTFVSVMPCCEKMNSLSHGECLHGCVIKYGLESQVSVAPALISMYAKLGEIDSATCIFDHMSNKNLLAWNSIISGFVNHGFLRKSLEAVREMNVSGFAPDSISVINVLSACSELHALHVGKSVHGITIRKGFDSNLNVSNLLLSFYSDCLQLDSSFKLFVRMPEKNTISWNTMISSCMNHGEICKAESLILDLQQEGLQLDVVSVISILPVVSESNNLALGMALHSYAIKFGFISDVTLANALISMYCNCDYLDAAVLVFRTMMRRCVVSWTALITGYRCQNLHEKASSLFKVMVSSGQKPNHITLLNVLPGCCTLLQGKSVHSYAIRTGAMIQNILVTSLISMYSRLKNVKLCHLLFKAGNKSDISLWNVMLSVFLEAKDPEKAFSLFRDLRHTKLKVDYVTVLSLVSACGQLNSISLGNCMLGFVVKNGFSIETSICNALTDFYAKNGDILMAKTVFDSLLYKDAVSWSTMINGYGLNGYSDSAITLLSQMKNSGLKPDRVTYLNLLSACNHSGLSEQSRIIFNSMLTSGVQPKMEHYACVVDLLCRTGELNEAYDLVATLPSEPSAGMLESLLSGCRVYGNVKLGEKVGELLIERDPENPRVYVTLYNVYAGAGRWEDANRIRELMDEKNLRKAAALSTLEGQTS